MARHVVARAALVALFACHGDGHGKPVDAAGDASPDGPVDATTDGGTTPNMYPTGVGGPPVGSCFEKWCWVYPLPQGHSLSGVWASSPADVWMTTIDGMLYHYDGAKWQEVGSGMWGNPNPQPYPLVGTASNDVWAALPAGIAHWDGSTWTSLGDGAAPFAAISATDVWASGGTKEWNGSTWTSHSGPGFTPIAIGGSPGSVLAVSNTGAIAKWLGTAWGIGDTGSHTCNSAVVIDGTHLAVAQNGSVSLWDTGTWTTLTPPVSANWEVITASSPTDLWIASFGRGTPYRYHWNGSTWTDASDPGTTAYPLAISEDPHGNVFLVLDDASIRVWNGSTWSAVTTGNNTTRAVWGTAPTDVWLVDPAPVLPNRLVHWNGTSWTESTFPFQTNYYLSSIWGSAPNDYWATAGYQASFSVVDRTFLHWDGSTWTEVGPYGTEDGVAAPTGFTRIWGTAADNVYAVARTAVYHRDASGWAPIAALSGGTDVFGTAANDVYVLQNTTMWHWDGSMWTSKTMPKSFTRGWENSPTDIWLVGFDTPMMHYDGAFFVDASAADAFYSSLPVGTAGEMYTFSSSGHMWRWPTGFGSTPEPLTEFFGVNDAWVAPDGHVWAAGGAGLLVH